ncbi:MAG: RHS repeat protein [Anaerolineae bacterium]|nr:RHS repeat protein [Anaerolineae bacterium]
MRWTTPPATATASNNAPWSPTSAATPPTTYDGRGNTTAITDPLTYSRLRLRQPNNLLQRTDARNPAPPPTSTTPHSNLTSAPTHAVGRQPWTYSSFGRLVGTTDANGRSTDYDLGANGYLSTVTGASGHNYTVDTCIGASE